MSSAATAAATESFLAGVLAAPELAREYPLVFDARFGGRTLELVRDGAVRSACAVLAREFHVAGRTLRAGLIGSVATDPAWRGQGLASELLAEAERALRAQGCLFALLWAEHPDFYLTRGYAPFAGEDDYLLVNELIPLLPEASGVRAFAPSDVPFLRRLHARHAAHVERSEAEFAALLAIPGMRVLVRERAAAPGHPPLPVAYACLGRGRDLPDTIHDWAGETEDVLALVRAHLEQRFAPGETGALFLMAPPQASELGYRLLALGAVVRRGILGLGKILDTTAAARLFDEFVGGEVATVRPEGVTLRGPASGAELDLDTLQALLFGGAEVRDEVRTFLQRLGFDGALPLPLEPFAFGLDSI
ncbi:MAG: GNAT family N-acetyltransferase [Planctomycetota bacterium]